jgi:sulfatase maturation enzyme AslB (radical SAM superfamily)
MTNICNSKCPFCFGFLDRASDRSSLTLPEASDIIRQIREFGGKGLTFTGGGEPLCNPSTVDAIVYARSLGLDVGFITNGILLTEKIARVLVDHCTWIRVSIDAGTRDTYRRTHGLDGTTFQDVINNTAMLVRVKKERGSNVTIGTGFITSPEVVEDMRAFVETSRDAGVDYAQFRPLLKNFRQKEINTRHDAKVLEALEQCQNMATGEFRVLCSLHKYRILHQGIPARNYGKCHGHHFATVISANRKMYLCCHMRGFADYCLGDLRTASLADIWKSERRKQVYENIDFKDCPLLCRCDGFNTILWSMCQASEHESFL